MNKFKSIDYSNIKDDEFIINSKRLIEFQNAKASGSYIRYGKDKSCDLDLSEKLEIDKTGISDLLEQYFNKLKLDEDKFILTRLSFDIIDESIQELLNNLGNLNGLLQIENSNINKTQIDKKLPKSMRKKIKKLILDYNENNDIYTYINLYMYLKNNLQPTFTIDEAINGKKKFNGNKIKLSDYNFTYMYIEVIYENFRISNFVYFKKINKIDSLTWDVELNEVLIDSLEETKNIYQMSYYKFLKYFFHFLKQSYFKKIFKEHVLVSKAIETYNNIYDFRESLGSMNYNLCKIENMIIINMDNIELKKEYTELKKQFELKCKNYFIQVTKPFLSYLKSYFKLI
jgi:hypothetical protein